MRAEVVSEAEARILTYVASGRSVASWVAFSAQIVRSVVRWLLRQERVRLVDPAVLSTLASDPAVEHTFEAAPDCPLRGATQKKLVAFVRAGRDCETIALELAQPVHEVRRQIRRLAQVIGAWRARNQTKKT